MELHHSFTVPVSLDDTWEAFGDVADVAECFPGATVTSHEGDQFEGTCKVKLGPIALVYAGAGSFLERDEAAHRLVIEAKGKDKRGNGTAKAVVTTRMTAGDEGTTVDVLTDLQITGKPAQFGRGVIQDVSDKLLDQFVACLQSRTTPAPVAETADTGDTGDTGDTSGQVSRPPPPPVEDAFDLGASVLPILARRYWKHALALVVVLLVLRRWLRR